MWANCWFLWFIICLKWRIKAWERFHNYVQYLWGFQNLSKCHNLDSLSLCKSTLTNKIHTNTFWTNRLLVNLRISNLGNVGHACTNILKPRNPYFLSFEAFVFVTLQLRILKRWILCLNIELRLGDGSNIKFNSFGVFHNWSKCHNLDSLSLCKHTLTNKKHTNTFWTNRLFVNLRISNLGNVGRACKIIPEPWNSQLWSFEALTFCKYASSNFEALNYLFQMSN